MKTCWKGRPEDYDVLNTVLKAADAWEMRCAPVVHVSALLALGCLARLGHSVMLFLAASFWWTTAVQAAFLEPGSEITGV